MSVYQGEDIYDIAPTNTTVKDFSKLIGRFDQRPQATGVTPVRHATQTKSPLQLPPKKLHVSSGPKSPGTMSPGPMSPSSMSPRPKNSGPLSPGPVSPGPVSPSALVTPDIVESVRKQLNVVPNKRDSAVRASQLNPAHPVSRKIAHPENCNERRTAPSPGAELNHRLSKVVPVEKGRATSSQISYADTASPPHKYDNNKVVSRESKVSTGSSNYAHVGTTFRKLPLPTVSDQPPPKPRKPPHVVMPSKCPCYRGIMG